jgi:A118 family predicted phage portal protein
MTLPEADTAWPPQGWERLFRNYAEHAAWYSGDPEQLADFYTHRTPHVGHRQWYRFWRRAGVPNTLNQLKAQMHIPLAGDIAATSASILFSEAPAVQIPEAHEESPNADAKTAEERLTDILTAGNVFARLAEAAESCAALGGVYLKVDWDTEVADFPFLTIVQADSVLPEFRFGRLRAATIVRCIDTQAEGEHVWWHVERHEPGRIEHGLYYGKSDNLGEVRDLEAHPLTARFEPLVTVPDKQLAISYIPNLRPNRRFRHLPLGQSDYSGAEDLLDALDEQWTSWVREIRLARARILVPEQFLENKPSGDGSVDLRFDVDQEVFVPMNVPGTAANNVGIITTQFQLHTEQYAASVAETVKQIVSHAGYSPQSFGLDTEGSSHSGEALRLRERSTLMTQQKKRRYWEPELESAFQLMLLVDAKILNHPNTLFRPNVVMADSLTPDISELAGSVQAIANAHAASTETLVRMLHPEWDEDQVQQEAQKIQEEAGTPVDSPFDVTQI